MTNSSDGGSPGRAASKAPAPAPSVRDEWQATRAETALATQLLKNEDDYLAPEKQEVGRQTGAGEHELFVSCDPAEALQQQFEHLHPEFITVHDIATASSRKLLASLAAAWGREPHKLIVRRQGYGTPLATLVFIEVPAEGGTVLRMYTTETDADSATRESLAHMLLGYSRLGVVLVGDLAVHAVAAALKPLHDAMIKGPWPNRHLLLLPLASASNLVTPGMELTRGTGVSVRTTPQVARPADAWGFVSGTWGRLREQGLTDGRSLPPLSTAVMPRPTAAAKPAGAATASPASASASAVPETDRAMADTEPTPLAMRPMPPTSAPPADTPKSLLDRYVHQLSELAGMGDLAPAPRRSQAAALSCWRRCSPAAAAWAWATACPTPRSRSARTTCCCAPCPDTRAWPCTRCSTRPTPT